MRRLLAALHDVGLSHLSPLIAELAWSRSSLLQFSHQPIIGFFPRSKAVGHRRMLANWAMRLQERLNRALA